MPVAHLAGPAPVLHPEKEHPVPEIFNVTEQATAQLDRARAGSAGRAAHNLYGGPQSTLTQTVIAIRAGAQLDEHENPGEATVLVLQGQVRISTADGADALEGSAGDLLIVPSGMHSVQAVSDCGILLTAAKLRAH